MAPPQLDSDRRCHAVLPDSGRCSRLSYADGWCLQHHPQLPEERRRRRNAILARQAVQAGMRDFWCQVAICALLLYLKKTAPEAADALRRKL